MMYISDWLATLLHVARLDSLLPPNVDSLNMWPMIRQGRRSDRLEIVLNLDQDPVAGTWSAAIRYITYFILFRLCGEHPFVPPQVSKLNAYTFDFS